MLFIKKYLIIPRGILAGKFARLFILKGGVKPFSYTLEINFFKEGRYFERKVC